MHRHKNITDFKDDNTLNIRVWTLQDQMTQIVVQLREQSELNS